MGAVFGASGTLGDERGRKLTLLCKLVGSRFGLAAFISPRSSESLVAPAWQIFVSHPPTLFSEGCLSWSPTVPGVSKLLYSFYHQVLTVCNKVV